VLQALSYAENFPGVKTPVLGIVSEVGGHCCHAEIGLREGCLLPEPSNAG
jgi:hypothetical protein